jgi:RNA polymerase sigma-70 factor (sigma-E family)
MTLACPALVGGPAASGAAVVDAYEGWAVSEAAGTASFSSEADQMVTELFTIHYTGLVRLATLLLRDQAVAEDAVQDAFISLHRRWKKLRDPGSAASYLRTSVVHNTRSIQRRRSVAARHPEDVPLDAPSAEFGALRGVAGNAVVESLRKLPARQREVLVLRYYADLSEAEIAEAMKISRGAVKSHASRGMAALRVSLEQWA